MKFGFELVADADRSEAGRKPVADLLARASSLIGQIPARSRSATSLGRSGLGWRRGVVASVVRRMNEVTLRRARLVLGWVTVFGRVYHHGM